MPRGAREIWCNKVGTFGHTTAGYWFSRLEGARCRFTLSLMGQHAFFQLLYADDIKWSAGGEGALEDLVLAIFSACVAGTPISWRKVKGGSEVERKLEEGLKELRRNGLLGTLQGVAARTSPSGSYDTNDIVRYLSRHLPAWGPERRWRILLLDFFFAHKGERIQRLCWERGYLLVFIGGGCTGALQPVDTHLHGFLSKDFQAMEMDMLTETSLLEDKRVPVLDRTTLMSFLVSIWQQSRHHLCTCKGFRNHMFTIALDGSEDHLGSEECLGYWRELDMPSLREQVMTDVRDEWKARRLPLCFESYQSLLQAFPPRGFVDVIEPGQEDEGAPLQEGECMWDDNAGSLSPPFADVPEDEAAVVAESSADMRGEAALVAESSEHPEICRRV